MQHDINNNALLLSILLADGITINQRNQHQQQQQQSSYQLPPQPFLPYQWPHQFPPVMLDPIAQQQFMMAMQQQQQQMAMFQNRILYHHPNGTPSGPVEPLIPNPVPLHVPPAHLPPLPHVTGPSSNGGSTESNQPLFIPPIALEHHHLVMQSPSQTQKFSQAIPIVSPGNINE